MIRDVYKNPTVNGKLMGETRKTDLSTSRKIPWSKKHKLTAIVTWLAVFFPGCWVSLEKNPEVSGDSWSWIRGMVFF